MSDNWIIPVILGLYHLTCVISWRLERKELMDRLMARDWHDYQYSKHIEKTLVPDGKDLRRDMTDELAQAEDLAPIEAFGMS